MSTRLLTTVFALVLLAACGAPHQPPEIELGSDREFIPAVVDAIDNVGVGPSLALDADGSPFVAYFGFPAELAPDEVPVSRPVYAPSLPAVLLASEADGIFTRGAVALASPPPNLVTIPFAPATEASVGRITPQGVNGTSIALDDRGGIHVAWVSNTGLWYASGDGSTSFSLERIVPLSPAADEAGPLGWPAIGLDDAGTPWIAFGDATGGEQAVMAATPSGDRWRVEPVATFGGCPGCPNPRRVAIGVAADGPLVVYSDPRADAPVAATLDGRAWRTETIEAGGGGIGLSLAIDADGAPRIAYYANDGSVHEARLDGARWSSTSIAEGGDPEDERLQTTGIAVDDEGTSYVAYYDAPDDRVALVSDRGGSFAAVETPGTDGGATPDVAVAPDGSELFLSWYDRADENLDLGLLGGAEGLALAKPSPTPEGTAPPPPASPTSGAGGGGDGGAPCETTGSEAEIAAPQGAAASGFDTDCLAIDAGSPATVTFDNQDPGVPHNWALYEDSGYTQSLAATPIQPGPATDSADLPKLSDSTYYFRCDVHPDTMTGQLYAVG